MELTLWITHYYPYKSLAYAVPNTGCPQGKNRISLELWNFVEFVFYCICIVYSWRNSKILKAILKFYSVWNYGIDSTIPWNADSSSSSREGARGHITGFKKSRRKKNPARPKPDGEKSNYLLFFASASLNASIAIRKANSLGAVVSPLDSAVLRLALTVTHTPFSLLLM